MIANNCENFFLSYLEWKENIRKIKRGDENMYDVKGHYKYLSENELLDYYLEKVY